jgi:adenosylcobinamide kinase/adenosylcobinamide-phosphate guanylyltransferase
VQKNQGNSVILVWRGVRSGKSRYAQELAEQSSRVTFVAAVACRDDEEIQREIERRRADLPAHRTTVEKPIALGRVVQTNKDNCDAIPIDCLPLFGANLMEAFGSNEAGLEACVQRVATVADTVLVMVAGLPLTLNGSFEGAYQ